MTVKEDIKKSVQNPPCTLAQTGNEKGEWEIKARYCNAVLLRFRFVVSRVCKKTYLKLTISSGLWKNKLMSA